MNKKIDMDLFYQCFINSMGVNKEDISMDKSLIHDLGAASLDLLDLVFQLEEAFEIEIPRDKLVNDIKEELTKKEFEKDGYITPEGVELIRQKHPEFKFSIKNKEQIKINDIPEMFTVKTFYNIVQTQLKEPVIQTN
jgi:acyl carrier protein